MSLVLNLKDIRENNDDYHIGFVLEFCFTQNDCWQLVLIPSFTTLSINPEYFPCFMTYYDKYFPDH